MKFIPVALAALAATLSFSSCKKENSANSNSSTALPKTYTEDVTSAALGHIVESFNLTYDGNNRLISMISASSPGDKFIYQYDSDNEFTLDLYNSGQLSIHDIYWISPNGFVDSSFQYNDTQDTTATKYVYNSSKQLIQQKEYDYSTISGSVLFSTDDYTYDGNGNMITDEGDYSTTSYDYYPDLLNSFSLGGTYFSQTKNLPKTVTVNTGGTIITITHTYTFDGNNRLTTDKAVADNGDIAIKTYTY